VVSALEELPGVKKAFASYPEKKAPANPLQTVWAGTVT
jgi:hypothetical protein